MTTKNTYTSRFQAGWTIKITLRRLLHQWRSLLTMIVGVLIATIIGASIPLYTAAVGQVGLQQTLASSDRADTHLALRTGVAGLTADAAATLDDELRPLVTQYLGAWTDRVVGWQETLPLPPERDGEIVEATRFRLGAYEDWEQHVTLESGSLPAAGPGAGFDVEAAASLEFAQAAGLNVGDTLTLRDGRDSSTPIQVRISGLVKAADDTDPYWPAAGPPLHAADPVGQWDLQGTLIINPDAFYPLVTNYLPDTTSNLGWRVLVNHPAITLNQIPEIAEALDGLDGELEGVNTGYVAAETGLSPLLLEYAAEADLLAAPFGLLIIQVGALTLYFLLMTAELIRHHERREISLMRSRGGQARQVWILRGLEALLICLVMIAAAPLIARVGLRQLGSIGPLTGLDIGALPLELTPAVYAYSAGAGLISWALLMFTLNPVLKAPLVTAAGVWDRPEKQAWWQRYYLDIALLVLGGVAYWQLSSYGSVLVQNVEGGLMIDPLLLLTPSLLMIAAGALLLRLFTPVMSLLANVLAGRNGLSAQLAGWQISRRPVHYGRIALMLALAIGMGWFATSFNATVVRSRSDRATYLTGADLRFTEVDTLLSQSRAQSAEAFSELPNVQQSTTAFRSRINASTQSNRSIFGELLAIDSETFGLTANWRPDLGVLAMPGKSRLGVPDAGRLLAPTPYRLGLWVSMRDVAPEHLLNQTALYVKLEDDDGNLVNLPLHPAVVEQELLEHVPDRADRRGSVYDDTGWVYLEADLTQADRPLMAPVRLRSLHWVFRSNTRFGGFNRIMFSDLVAYDANGTATPLNWLDTTIGWRYVDDGVSPSEGTLNSDNELRNGQPGLTVEWAQDGRTSAMGLIVDSTPAGSLPAVVSSSFLSANGLSGQEPFQLNVMDTPLLFRVVARMDVYPTLYGNERPFLITDRDQLLYALNLKPSTTLYANEVWLRLADAEQSEATLAAAEDSDPFFAVQNEWLKTEVEHQMQTNPLTVGLTGLFFIAFGVALLLSTFSLLSYVAITAQSRRVEFSVLQSMGTSPRHLLASLALEQLLVLGTGALVGGVLGALLGNQILPFLSVTEGGQVIVPPFVVETGVELLAGYALVMLAVFAILLLSSLWLLRRLPLARTLRLGDE